MLKLENLSKKYEKFELKNISFELEKGSIMGLIGKNGAGKTTLISTILDLSRKTSGSCKIFGTENNLLTPDQKENIGIVFDELHFPKDMKMKEIQKLCSLLYKTWDNQKFRQLLFEYDITGKFNEPIKNLSKGMKMKLQFAIALSHDTKLLILDEATAGLDPIIKDQILDYLFDFVSDGKKSVLMSSHILSDIEKIADTICYIDYGKVILSGYKDELLEKYCIIKGEENEIYKLGSENILGLKRSKYYCEALVEKENAKDLEYDIPTIEDIMIFLNHRL